MSIATTWNTKQKELRANILKEETFPRAKELFLELHSLVHTKRISNCLEDTYLDILYQDLQEKQWIIMPTAKDVTIAWNIWHITRIEDLTVNLLLRHTNQVLNDTWLTKMGISVTDTGNAMNDDEIMKLSKNVNKKALIAYRNEVGKRTREYLKDLTFEDMKRKMQDEDLQRILLEGGVTSHPDSIWLVDFWGRKTVSGIILMPITRHQIGHINDSLRLKKVTSKTRAFYRQ